jgi:hypothetical protein
MSQFAGFYDGELIIAGTTTESDFDIEDLVADKTVLVTFINGPHKYKEAEARIRGDLISFKIPMADGDRHFSGVFRACPPKTGCITGMFVDYLRADARKQESTETLGVDDGGYTGSQPRE